MKHFSSIFLFVFSYLLSDTSPTDVKHIVIDHNGNTTECFVDSIGYQYVYFIPSDSVDTDSMKLKNAYYIHSDYDRIFHHSWSFEENIKRMENRTGKAYTINGDTLHFIDIKFDKDMITPEVLLTTGPGKSKYISMFDLEKIETDFSIMAYSVERGFFYSFYTFLIAATFEIIASWDKERRMVPQIWDQYDDLLPKVSIIGLNKQKGNGVAYESFTSLIPLTVLISMAYDVYKEKNKFYFSPVYEKREFGRNMHVFSLKQLVRNGFDEIIYKLEKNSFGRKVIGLFR